jgi:hypothetical protein
MSFQPSRFGIPRDQIVRPQRNWESPVPAGIPFNPDTRIISSRQVVLQTTTSGARCLAAYANGDLANLPEGQRSQSHEDLYRLGLRWHDASLFGTSGKPLSLEDENDLRNCLIKEYAITIHAIGAKAAWQGATPATVLEGLVQMEHAIDLHTSIDPALPQLLSPRELIRTARWGRLLPQGFDQPAIGRWLPGGGLIYRKTGSSWQALAPLKAAENQFSGANQT